MKPQIDDTDRRIINRLQSGLPVTAEPYAAAAAELAIPEPELLERLTNLKAKGILSRIGPMYNSGQFGGGLSLCAMRVPQERFREVAEIVNSFPEVAHNYEREHGFNMWFVLATETQAGIRDVIARIEGLTNIKVLNLPKIDEYFVGMKVEA